MQLPVAKFSSRFDRLFPKTCVYLVCEMNRGLHTLLMSVEHQRGSRKGEVIMNLGEKIYELRTARNLSQGDVADALEVSRQSVSKWENNSAVPDLDKIIKLAELFGVSLDELVLNRSKDIAQAYKEPDGKEQAVEQTTEQTTEQNNPVQPQIIIEKAPVSGRKIAGTILFCMAFLVVLVCTIIDGAEGLLAGILFSVPFILCGTICFKVEKHTGLWCAWAVYICVDAYLRVATGVSWKTILWSFYYAADMKMNIRLLVGWAEFAVMLALMGWTIWTFAKEPGGIKKKTIIFLVGGTVLVMAVSSLFGIMFVYRWTQIVSAVFDWLIKFLFMASVVAIIRYVKNKKKQRKQE